MRSAGGGGGGGGGGGHWEDHWLFDRALIQSCAVENRYIKISL